MRDFYKFEKRSKYPHMKPADAELIDRFIEKYPDYFDEAAYSYPVGDGAPANPIVNEETEGSVEYLYMRKIDIVGKKRNFFSVVEVKPRASLSAIGQIKGYYDLFFRDEKPSGEVVKIIITDKMDNDSKFVAAKEGVIVIEV